MNADVSESGDRWVEAQYLMLEGSRAPLLQRYQTSTPMSHGNELRARCLHRELALEDTSRWGWPYSIRLEGGLPPAGSGQ